MGPGDLVAGFWNRSQNFRNPKQQGHRRTGARSALRTSADETAIIFSKTLPLRGSYQHLQPPCPAIQVSVSMGKTLLGQVFASSWVSKGGVLVIYCCVTSYSET